MFGTSIKRRVMAVVNEKIEAAQKYHDEELKVLEEKHKAEKEILTDNVVNSLIGVFTK